MVKMLQWGRAPEGALAPGVVCTALLGYFFIYDFMKTIYLAQMQWCEHNEPICAGTNKQRVAREALRILKLEHGTGPISRGLAMCSVPITMSDIEVVEIPLLLPNVGDGPHGPPSHSR